MVTKRALMRAVRLHELGGPDDLVLEEIPIPRAGEGEAVVRVRAAALNHRDLFITQGRYAGIQLPRTLGADAAGEFDGKAVLIDPTIGWGSDPRAWAPEATILGMPRDGTFAEFVAVPAGNVHPKPEHLSFEEAAALPLAGVTAFRALFTRGELQGGETVLITGAGGGVQTFVLLFAKAAGARIIATTTSSEKIAKARELGADEVLDYGNEEWHKTSRGTRIDLVVDSTGGETFVKGLSTLRRGGRAVTYGGTTGDAKLRMYSVFWNQLDVRGTSMGSPSDFAAMLQFVRKHSIRPVIDGVYPLQEIRSAMFRMSEAQQFGRIVLRVSG